MANLTITGSKNTTSAIVDGGETTQTGDFSALPLGDYLIDTTAGTIVLTLPPTPQIGDKVKFKDKAGTFDLSLSQLTLDRNGSDIEGVSADVDITSKWYSGEATYVGGTTGWALYPPRFAHNPVFV